MKKISQIKIDLERGSVSGIIIDTETKKSEFFSIRDKKSVVQKLQKLNSEGKLVSHVETEMVDGVETIISKTPIMEEKEIVSAEHNVANHLGSEKEKFDILVFELVEIFENKLNVKEEVIVELEETIAEETESSEESTESESEVVIEEGEVIEVETESEENLSEEDKENSEHIEGEYEVVEESEEETETKEEAVPVKETKKQKLRKINSSRKK